MDAVASNTSRILADLHRRLERIETHMDALEKEHAAEIATIPRDARASASNLIHYLALRQHDLRLLQRWLSAIGISSLGHTEAYVKPGLHAVLALMARLDSGESGAPPPDPVAQRAAMRRMQHRLWRRTQALFGTRRRGRPVRIMVTMPSEAATDPALVREMLAAGMDVMRINCAHDGPEAWKAMVENLKTASMALNQPCRVLMDLAGPKLRTGPIQEGAKVMRVRPERDALGQEREAALVRLVPAGGSVPPGAVPVRADPWPVLQEGAGLRLSDARGRSRRWRVVTSSEQELVCEAKRTTYLVPGSVLKLPGHAGRLTVTDLPAIRGEIALREGEYLFLDGMPGRIGEAAQPGAMEKDGAAHVPFTCPEVIPDIRDGQPIWFDDGKIGGVVEENTGEGLWVRITHTRPSGSKLRADKGVNLPGAPLRIPALSDKDLDDLRHAIQLADMVGLSFVRTPEDVRALRTALRRFHGERLGIVLKVETQQGVNNLPYLLLEALKHDRVGVMIARGDMAIECDYRRMAELQEEILWFCEAAHVPVIWATQVLDTLARTGVPSRAEISDASMGERAECVMLNKGPHIKIAIRVLDDILRRMSGHQEKKTQRLRPLRLAGAGDRAGRRTVRIW